MADWSSIRYFDNTKNVVTPIAGTGWEDADSKDGIGAAARFRQIQSILITSDGAVIWCCQRDGLLRRIDTASRAVTTHRVNEDGLRAMIDRVLSMIVSSDGATLWCGLSVGIRRFDTFTRKMSGSCVPGLDWSRNR